MFIYPRCIYIELNLSPLLWFVKLFNISKILFPLIHIEIYFLEHSRSISCIWMWLGGTRNCISEADHLYHDESTRGNWNIRRQSIQSVFGRLCIGKSFSWSQQHSNKTYLSANAANESEVKIQTKQFKTLYRRIHQVVSIYIKDSLHLTTVWSSLSNLLRFLECSCSPDNKSQL